MNSTTNKHIALISVHGDPAIEIDKEEAGGQNIYVRHVAEALAQQGWQVDMFTRKVSAEQQTIVQHNQKCRTIRLKAGSVEFVPRDNLFNYLSEFVENFLKFQTEEGIKYDLIHTNDYLSSWVGIQLKKIQGSEEIHTYYSSEAVKYNNPQTQSTDHNRSTNKQSQLGSLRNIQAGLVNQNTKTTDMDKQAQSIISTPHDRSELGSDANPKFDTASFTKQMNNTLHKNPSSNNQKSNKATAITTIITLGVVALMAIWVIGQSDCGARLHFRIWPSPDIRLEKLACRPQ